MSKFQSTKVIELGSAAFRQWKAKSHCRFLHGYRLTSKLWFSCDELDENNWVVDFGSLKELKDRLRGLFDHKTCIALDDPDYETFIELNERNIIQMTTFNNGVGIEMFANRVFEIASEYINELTEGRCRVDKVEVFEHDLNSAIVVVPKQVTIKAETEDDEKPQGQQPAAKPPEQPAPPAPIPAPVGQRPTPGKGNLFEGTSWGD